MNVRETIPVGKGVNSPAYERHRPPSLWRNATWMFAATVAAAVCHWLTIVLPARLGLTQFVGEVALAYAVGMPLFSLASLHLRGLLATDASNHFLFREYLAVRCVGVLFGLCALLALSFYNGGSSQTAAMLTIGMAIAVDSLSDIFFGYQQKHERLDRVALSLLVRGPLGLAGYYLALKLTEQAWVGGLGLLAGRSLALLAIDIPCAIALSHTSHQTKPFKNSADATTGDAEIRASRLVHLAWQALPLGITILLVDLQLNLPRMRLEAHHGLLALGLLAGLTSFLNLGGLVIGPLAQTVVPRLGAYFVAGQHADFVRLVGCLAGVAALIGLSGLAISFHCSELLLTSILGEKYGHLRDDLPWIMLALLFRNIASALGYVVTAAKIIKAQPLVHLCGLLVIFTCGELWIPAFGVHGAVLAIAAGTGFLAVAFGVLTITAIQTVERHSDHCLWKQASRTAIAIPLTADIPSSLRVGQCLQRESQ